ncbi:Valine--tRNA ligase [Rickettsiales endosymbiont of Paramecium tredecaurelia]|uniref:valine--tRNA ligase n=1 Tax=Candidatus Sarmatiella mevalonica TaxID=2770581 RepID=UPI0019238EBA|nr:valine--tRNA ligase [Candidatus Sarmatiella mevalonica]MBL3284330.1 Valine--tRNA ligase [Candidatus Sarmatiella mevalonica]
MDLINKLKEQFLSSKSYDFQLIQTIAQDFWQETAVYAYNRELQDPDACFVIDTPPPTVSGLLHIGHVYSYTHTDFIARFQRLIGKNVFYPMGFDDNGLPTERLVEKNLDIKAHQLSRNDFRDKCLEIIKNYEQQFQDLFQRIGLSVDWSLLYQSINTNSQALSQSSFIELLEKNLAYRAQEPVFWDCVDQTALAQADIEDKEKPSVMYHILFDQLDSQNLVIATTRPELMPAVVAVLCNPDDSRYTRFVGKQLTSPLFAHKVPLIADDAVDPEKGTGLVMCCTFGDTTDVLWWRKYKLPTRIIIDKQGNIIHSFSILPELNGMKVNKARAYIIEALGDAVIHQEPLVHRVKCAERSGAPLEILVNNQWFIKTVEFREELLRMVDQIQWRPESMKIKLQNWIKGVAWDWCISRQRFSGVPVPVWYSKRAGEEGRVLLPSKQELPIDPVNSLPHGYGATEVEPDFDVFDTWMTSSISPELATDAVLGKRIVDLRPQAHEILRTWAFYTLLNSYLRFGRQPWHNIMISGWCLAHDKSKMSKSKGNIVEPDQLLNLYGPDVLRYWTAKSKLGADTCYSENVLKIGKRLVNKLWNAAKFLELNLSDQPQEGADIKLITHPLDRYYFNKLLKVAEQYQGYMMSYEYSMAMEEIESFFLFAFCDDYLEIVKGRIYQNHPDSQKNSALCFLRHSFKIILKLFSVFMPYVTECIYLGLYDVQSIHTKGSWIAHNPVALSQGQEREVEYLLDILNIVRKVKSEKHLSIKAEISKLQINVALDSSLLEDLKNVTNAQNLEIALNTDCTFVHVGEITKINIIL